LKIMDLLYGYGSNYGLNAARTSTFKGHSDYH
jgi:hypothetical protein